MDRTPNFFTENIKQEPQKDNEPTIEINDTDISIISIKYPYLNMDKKEEYSVDNISNE